MADKTIEIAGFGRIFYEVSAGVYVEGVALGSLLAGENETYNRLMTAPSYTPTHLAANATTTLKSRPGILHSIAINTKGAASNVMTVYDNTAGSGTVIAIIDTTVQPVTLVFNGAFAIGLTIVIGTGTACDATISWL